MYLKTLILLFLVAFHTSCGSKQKNGTKDSTKDTETIPSESKKVVDLPYYFMAIHMEPEENQQILNSMYTALKELIQQADQYNMKLTIMFAHTWADYLTDKNTPERQADLAKWKSKHEISAHHHSIYHPYQWDGYSHLSESAALAERAKSKTTNVVESYKGNMQDYMSKLKQIDANIQSGCLNEERSKAYLPNEIIYLTCSGYQNFGEPGTYAGSDINVKKGTNEYINVFTLNGIKRKWLAHASNISLGELDQTKAQFDTLKSGVYGVVTHGFKDDKRDEITPLINLMKYYHQKDPQGLNSKTVSEIIKQGLLPEKEITMTDPPAPPSGGGGGGGGGSTTNPLCGDNICDAFEKANPQVCPRDCTNN